MKTLDFDLPLQFLKFQRSELILKWARDEPAPSPKELQEVANIQLAIMATEAVIAELDEGVC